MQVEFKNRYNDSIVFTRMDENQFLMQGFKHFRTGWASEEDRIANKYCFVDPSGGPYVSQGMTMGYIDMRWIGKIVDHIAFADPTDKQNNNMIIHTYPEYIASALVNNIPEFRIYSERGEIVEKVSCFNDAVKWIEDKYEKG